MMFTQGQIKLRAARLACKLISAHFYYFTRSACHVQTRRGGIPVNHGAAWTDRLQYTRRRVNPVRATAAGVLEQPQTAVWGRVCGSCDEQTHGIRHL